MILLNKGRKVGLLKLYFFGGPAVIGRIPNVVGNWAEDRKETSWFSRDNL
jgi:hypothetical protein